MALIRCPECDATISDRANACVRCGYPIARDGTDIRFVLDKTGELPSGNVPAAPAPARGRWMRYVTRAALALAGAAVLLVVAFLVLALTRFDPFGGAFTAGPAGAADSQVAPPAVRTDAEIAAAIGEVVADLARRVPQGFEALKGEPTTAGGECSSARVRCWRSTITLPVTDTYGATAIVAETDPNPGWFDQKEPPMIQTHGIELTASAEIEGDARSLFVNAIAAELRDFRADGENSWCRPIDDGRTAVVEVGGAERTFTAAVAIWRMPPPPECASPTQAAPRQLSETERLLMQCEQGTARSCSLLARRHATGEGVARDSARAAAFARRGCDGGDGLGCAWAANLETEKDRARPLARKACEIGEPFGCAIYGHLAADAATAAASYKRACTGGNAEGCESLGEMCFELSLAEACEIIDDATLETMMEVMSRARRSP